MTVTLVESVDLDVGAGLFAFSAVSVHAIFKISPHLPPYLMSITLSAMLSVWSCCSAVEGITTVRTNMAGQRYFHQFIGSDHLEMRFQISVYSAWHLAAVQSGMMALVCPSNQHVETLLFCPKYLILGLRSTMQPQAVIFSAWRLFCPVVPVLTPLTSGGAPPCTTLPPLTWTGGTDLRSAMLSFHAGVPDRKDASLQV